MITDLDILKKDLVYIENIKSFLVDIPKVHPDNPRYDVIWKQYTKHCIEGFWAYDNGGYRFMPPTLFFYGSFFKIEHTIKSKKQRTYIKPILRDIDWKIHYGYIEAQGFSGFDQDDVYTGDIALVNSQVFSQLEKSSDPEDRKRYLHLHRKDGRLKQYKHPRELLYGLHTGDLGRPKYFNEAKNLMVFGCLAENSKIRMFDGSIKNVQELVLGDKLMGPDSNERTIKSLYQGEGFMYKIKSKYSEDLHVTDTHILRLRKRICKYVKGKYTVSYKDQNISVGEYLNNIYHTKLHREYEIINSSVEYPCQDTKWNPYLLGLWLGDGFKACRKICVNEDDVEIINWLKDYFQKNNIKFNIKEEPRHQSSLGHNKKIFRINWLDTQNDSVKGNWFAKTLLHNKHIPNEYLINDSATRLALLAGMIDSDGSYESKGSRFTITNVDLNLLTQFQDLARSLGFRATIHKVENSGLNKSVRYDLRITGNISKIPTQLSRKKAKDSKHQHLNRFEITFDNIQKFYGLEIDQDNLFVLGDYSVTHNCRGGGKSFSVAGIITQHLTFDGIKEYTKETFDHPQTISVVVGAAVGQKSNDLIAKVTKVLNIYATDQSLGAWGTPRSLDFTPNPFYRDWVGDTKPGSKNPFRYVYNIQTPNGWSEQGTGTSLEHVNYSDKKQDAATAAAGKRTALSVYEEVGLQPNFIDALLSNEATVRVDGEQFGVQLALGTSGDIELVQQSKKVFTNPSEYNFLAFPNIWESDDAEIGLFIPAYLSDIRFKDANGNTNLEEAIKFFMDRRIDKMSKNDPKLIANEKMNAPLVPSDMWISNHGTYFPQIELLEQEQRLMRDNKYKTLSTPVKLRWDSSQQYGVAWEYDSESEPFYEFPYDKSMSKLDGAILIFRHPELIKGVIPSDMYLHVLDPYVSENIDNGGSLGSFQTYLNPKYHKEGISGTLVCSYHGKHESGKDAFYSNVEKIIAYYGNCTRSLWFEANRGESVRGYFLRKDKLYLLAPRPTREQGTGIYAKRVLEYGYYVNGRTDKIEMIDDAAEWLLKRITCDGVEQRVLETIDDIFLIKQLIQFELKGNYDAVMAMLGFPLALKEIQHDIEHEEKTKGKLNPLGAISMNPNLFKDSDTISRLKRFKQLYETE